jgi:hypothetical protein
MQLRNSVCICIVNLIYASLYVKVQSVYVRHRAITDEHETHNMHNTRHRIISLIRALQKI